MEDKHQLAGDLLRTPDWRARTAAMLAAELRNPSPRLYDERTRALVDFLAQRSRNESCARRPARLHERLFCVSSAWAIHESITGGLRYAIEAQLLTERSMDEIAASVGMPLDVITCYADLYFDVADRLQSPQFIVHYVFEDCRLPSPGDFRDVGWKSVAYAAGPAALDVAMGIGRVEDRRHWLDQLRDQTDCIVQAKLGRLVLESSVENFTVLCKSAQLGIAADKSRAENAPTQFEANAKAFLEVLNFDVGKPRDPKSLFGPFVGAAVELRADDQVRLARGEAIENQDELLGLHIPEPRATEVST